MDANKDIKKEREKLRLKQIQVAKVAQIDASKLSKIENGWLKPRPDEIERIKAAMMALVED